MAVKVRVEAVASGVIILLIVLSGYSLSTLYQSLPKIVAVTCDIYGNPMYGLKSEILYGQVLPVFLTSAILSLTFHSLSLKPKLFLSLFASILGKVGVNVDMCGRDVFYLLTVFSIYVVMLGWWIGHTSLVSSSRDTPLYPSLILMWYLSGLSITFVSALAYFLMKSLGV